MAFKGFAWTSFHFDSDEDEAAYRVFPKLLRGQELWWVSKNWKYGVWWCRNVISAFEKLIKLQTEKDVSSIRWWVQEPGETIFLPFAVSHQVVTFDPTRTVLLTWEVVPEDPMEETKKEVMLRNSLTQLGSGVGSVKKLKMPSALGRHRVGVIQTKIIKKVSKHCKLLQSFHF